MTKPLSPGPDDGRPDTQAILSLLNARTLGFDAWHDGHGYPLDALKTMNATTREALARSVVVRDWREVQLLASLDTPAAGEALRSAFNAAGVARSEIGLALLRWRPDCLHEFERTTLVCNALERAKGGDGLHAALQAVQDWHPATVIETLWKTLESADSTVVVHGAALLFYLHGLAAEPFDIALRMDFLQFASEDATERAAAQMQLRQRIDAHHPMALRPSTIDPPDLKGTPPA